ncbi:Putative uncharacterized protein [Taphrina deformans PYCC 5710]|uniref:EB1 C-terminal domain-containing protein n=1 Tax=Taphrina deformans (strain PYCC 5710 / ATCC 11124 / CBS 356.35 / IMI 108563 / JCM 9778 / NBRC 8474) TaxID=1097556 RepID=R4X6C5_TAPDE|nr:Putative uncharacterized protein [Taphrina deformans PYCC 5710]|eukprot:CCG80570.1 Putative uncharacterized protein [Taphrina deformans PYCC 5710]
MATVGMIDPMLSQPGDVPMKKIDFHANTEVKYLANWKVVQTNMAKHKIDKIVPIDRLVKCKMQDNLEFLQWCKKYWDQYFPGGDYDAAGRRGGLVPASLASSQSNAAPPIRTTVSSASSSAAPPRRAAGTAPARTTPRAASTSQSLALQKEIEVLNETVVGLEKERDFYFNKLRDIEILIQNATETDPAATEAEGGLVKQIQEVLYSTEEGFEVPQPENELEEGVTAMAVGQDANHEDEDEVF